MQISIFQYLVMEEVKFGQSLIRLQLPTHFVFYIQTITSVSG
jgi:hypothetical protein